MSDYSKVDKIRLAIPIILVLLLVLSMVLQNTVSTVYLDFSVYIGLSILGLIEFFKGCKSRALFYFVVLFMNFSF